MLLLSFPYHALHLCDDKLSLREKKSELSRREHKSKSVGENLGKGQNKLSSRTKAEATFRVCDAKLRKAGALQRQSVSQSAT